jgi:hypothetical protein
MVIRSAGFLQSRPDIIFFRSAGVDGSSGLGSQWRIAWRAKSAERGDSRSGQGVSTLLVADVWFATATDTFRQDDDGEDDEEEHEEDADDDGGSASASNG